MKTTEIIGTDKDSSVRRLFYFLVRNGTEGITGNLLSKRRNLLENMIRHFEETEEYEKCTFLKVIQEHLGIPNPYELKD